MMKLKNTYLVAYKKILYFNRLFLVRLSFLLFFTFILSACSRSSNKGERRFQEPFSSSFCFLEVTVGAVAVHSSHEITKEEIKQECSKMDSKITQIINNREWEAFFSTDNPVKNPGERAVYTSLSKKTAVKEILENNPQITLNQVQEVFHFNSKNIKLDKVLDLTDTNVLRHFKVGKKSLQTTDITKKLTKQTRDAYELTQILGHIAKRKGFKAIKAPSAADRTRKGINIISFTELK